MKVIVAEYHSPNPTEWHENTFKTELAENMVMHIHSSHNTDFVNQ